MGSTGDTRTSSRARVLELLEQAEQPLDIATLSTLTGLHPNTLRGHLDLLADTGLVRRSRQLRSRAGRPRTLYSAREREHHANPYRVLAGELAVGLSSDPSGAAGSRLAGEHWARTVREAEGITPEQTLTADEAVALAVRGFDGLGFAAETDPLGDRIYLRSCPFGELARTTPSVCRLHADLLRGFLEELGAEIELGHLDVFVRPDLCVAHLRRSGRETISPVAPDSSSTPTPREALS